ncbi:hypothetical protein F0562_008898 [Nyssa sinensis]|uniref:Uncharacterized protein n=1 Tax=Nyssa sinensis TaxID=561372 RepID=A0A5J5A7J6_9ASTE|nr:hypothetical protein F0562_008898 [Nyssa sinensis]
MSRWKDVSFPKPLYPLVHPAVLVETFEHGESILHYVDELEGHENIKSALAHIGTHALLKMLLVDNFIHADMHPGNILVRASQSKASHKQLFKSKPHVIFLDVGMTAELSKKDQVNLLEFFKAVALRDGRTAAECTLKLSKQQNCPNPEAFIEEVEKSFDYWGSAEGDYFHPAECMQQLLEQVRRHRVNIDGNACTVMVTTLVLEGWQRKLDPEYDVMSTLKTLQQQQSSQQQRRRRRKRRRRRRRRRCSCTGAKKGNQKCNMDFRIPKRAKQVWDEWNIRIAVLVSLFFQVVLIFTATSRKRTGHIIVNMIIWSAYLLADWVAAFSVGLISNGQGNDCDKNEVNEGLAAFWAPFLLLHLGGPDTITAFSLEDNELWIRHALGLVIQVVAVVYVFSQSLVNDFWIPTVLLIIAGTIKYFERTRALYLACLGNFKNKMLPKPDAGPNYAQLMEEYTAKETAQVPVQIVIEPEPEKDLPVIPDFNKVETDSTNILDDVEIVEKGYKFFKTFKGLIVDLMFSFHERNESRNFFFERNSKDAFKVMEVELNFMYDVLYTKMDVVHTKFAYFRRLLCSALIVISFQRFASHHKHKIHHFDIAITYTLLIGAIGLDLVALFKLVFSDWTIVLRKRAKSFISDVRDKLTVEKRCRWSKSISQHSLISYCLKEKEGFKWFDKAADFFGLKEFLDEIQYKKTKPVEDNLKRFIFSELRAKAEYAKDSKIAKEIYSVRGDWAISQYTCHYPSIVSSVSEVVEYDESLLRWHIATELCYFTTMNENDPNREFCKLLSEYMFYLLVMRPTMMSAVAGIGQIRFGDTCQEAKKFFRKGKSISKTPILTALMTTVQNCFGYIYEKMKKCSCRSQSQLEEEKRRVACEKLLAVNTVVRPIEVKGDRSKSVLFDACMLAKDLQKLNKQKMWEMMSKVWVELLSYAASHCRANTHAQQLSKGGELITFVWLLMAHFGLGEHFRIEAGHARAKLIVEK